MGALGWLANLQRASTCDIHMHGLDFFDYVLDID
jgi:hypothetical protein